MRPEALNVRVVHKDREMLSVIPVIVFWGTTYVLLHPETKDRIKEWLQDTTEKLSYRFAVWETLSNIRALPETDHINN